MTRVLKNKNDLLEFASSLVESVVNSTLMEMGLNEKEAQVHQAAKTPNLATKAQNNPASQQQSSPPPPENNPYAGKDHPQEDLDQPTIEMVVDKLNAIRSGRSFRDSSVKGAMEQYFEKLGDAEKSALLTFLKGISQIVTGEVQGQQAVDPNDKTPGVQMNKSSAPPAQNNPAPASAPQGSAKSVGRKVKNVTVVRPPSRGPGVPAKGSEDTSAPSPIRPKSR